MKIIRKLVPDSLYGRFVLIILVPALLLQILATVIFYERHWLDVKRYMLSGLMGEIRAFVTIFKDQDLGDDDKNYLIKELGELMQFKVQYRPKTKLKLVEQYDPEMIQLANNITTLTNSKTTIEYINNKADLIIYMQIKQGVLQIEISRKRFYTPTTYIFIMWMIAISTILAMVALLFTRIQIRSITRLADAAEKLGKGHNIAKFKPEGAKEVRKAGYAFLKMKDRIERQITQRTEMLAGVSHDLRTPITRIKLALAMQTDSSEINEIRNDILEMEHMIREYIDFARGDSGEEAKFVDIVSVLSQVIDKFKNDNILIEFNSNMQNFLISLRIVAIKRMLSNIIANATKFGNEIKIHLMVSEHFIRIIFEDNGIGIPMSEYDNIFKPFYRIDEARNLQNGGAGLGLAIARDIASSHGGKIEVAKSKTLGGAMFIVTLPI
jgi:two-component system, OmpR family, osmolarity sensor histidine kinase EnvZ